MLAMQYSIALPPEFTLDKVRERVSRRRGLFDNHEGLVHKSFLYNAGEQVYAPFYLWKDVTAARDFLLDELFKGVVETFSRHRVRSWLTVHVAHGNRSITPAYARREIDVIAPEEKLDLFLAQEKAAQDALLKNDALCMHVVAIDADRWEILRFSLWKDAASAEKPGCDAVVGYDVLHVSQPDRFS